MGTPRVGSQGIQAAARTVGVARVTALIPDLLFGSRVQADLSAAGYEVDLVDALGPRLEADVLIVDLTSDAETRISAAGEHRVRKLAFYAHVETDVRRLAEEAGFDLVVPRSRMARQGPELVASLVSNMA